jgi:serine/threonine protein kinase
VAVKVIRVLQPNNILDLTERYEELLQEIRVWGRLQNEHILPVLGHVYGHGHLPSLVFPWMENGSLTNFLREHETLERGERFRLVGSSDPIWHLCTNEFPYVQLQDVALALQYCTSAHLQKCGFSSGFFISALYRSGSRRSNRCEFLPKSTRQMSTNYRQFGWCVRTTFWLTGRGVLL